MRQPTDAWCSQCFETGSDPVFGERPVLTEQPQSLPVSVRHSRWRASTTTFGPVGRVLATLLLFVPVWWFWHMQTVAWPGLVIWCVFLLPWGLRDVWRRGRIPHG